MYSYRGRGGPRQATPANVQCQKCLKRDKCTIFIAPRASANTAERHYSYECKESAQARPYVSRPSRTQQLRNPKLMPKLTNDTLDDAQRKKGVADEELAKKEAERARKRDLEERDDELIRQTEGKRRRSMSVNSISTISTDRSASAPSPVPVRRRKQRPPEERKRSEGGSFSPKSDDHSISRRSARSRKTQSPPRHRQRSFSRDSRSPPANQKRKYRERDEDYARLAARPIQDRPHGPESTGSRESSVPRSVDHQRAGRRSFSGSPDRHVSKFGGRSRGGERGSPYRGEPESRSERADRNDTQKSGSGYRPPERERSLSPFSKRLALTQAMNIGR